MNYYLIAGEASGDLHAARIMEALSEQDPGSNFRYIGGDRMESVAPGGLVRHYRDLNVMGLFAVIARLGFFFRVLSATRKDIVAYGPDALILVDYAGFNLRIARFASARKIPVLYYIAPKVWAWKKSRINTLKKYTDRLFVILPFEPDFFSRHDMKVSYFGNPLADDIAAFRSSKEAGSDLSPHMESDPRPVVALLAGSRKQEISRCLPVMLSVARKYPDFRFLVAGAPSVDPEVYGKYMQDTDAELIMGETYSILKHAFAAVVTSGTATLETALFGVPQVVVYKTGWLTYRIGKLFVKLRFFGLVNLISNRELVRELLQVKLESRLSNELARLLNDREYREGIKAGYREIEGMLGAPGVSGRIASGMIDVIKQKRNDS